MRSLFGRRLESDLSLGFPLLTTKKMYFKGIVEELLSPLRGDIDTSLLRDKGVTRWDSYTTNDFQESIGLECLSENLIGPIYGYQWRHYGSVYDVHKGGPLLAGKHVVE